MYLGGIFIFWITSPLLFVLHNDKESSCPRCIALEMMVENECEICLRHPVAVKYVDRKWIQRGFRYTVCLILMHLLFHVCLMVYTMRVIGAERRRTKLRRKYSVNCWHTLNSYTWYSLEFIRCCISKFIFYTNHMVAILLYNIEL